jgi:hypothetical protein
MSPEGRSWDCCIWVRFWLKRNARTRAAVPLECWWTHADRGTRVTLTDLTPGGGPPPFFLPPPPLSPMAAAAAAASRAARRVLSPRLLLTASRRLHASTRAVLPWAVSTACSPSCLIVLIPIRPAGASEGAAREASTSFIHPAAVVHPDAAIGQVKPPACSHARHTLTHSRGWLSEFMETSSGARTTYFSTTIWPTIHGAAVLALLGLAHARLVITVPIAYRINASWPSPFASTFFFFSKLCCFLRSSGLAWAGRFIVENQCSYDLWTNFAGCLSWPILHRGGFSEDWWWLSVTHREPCHGTYRARRGVCCSHVWWNLPIFFSCFYP